MERVLGSRPVNGFWSSGLQCRCSGFSKANQCQLMSPLKAHLGSSPAPLLAELQPFAWLSHHLRWEKHGLQLLMSSLVLLDSKHKALKPSLTARRSLAHGSWSCSPRKNCFPHTCEHLRGTDGYVRAVLDLVQNLGSAAPPPCCPRRRFPAQVFPGAGHGSHWHGLGGLKGNKSKTSVSHVSPSSHCALQQSLHHGAGGLVRDEKEHVSKWNHAAGE